MPLHDGRPEFYNLQFWFLSRRTELQVMEAPRRRITIISVQCPVANVLPHLKHGILSAKSSQGAPNEPLSLGEGSAESRRRFGRVSARGNTMSRREVVTPLAETQRVPRRGSTFLSARLANPFEAPSNRPCFPPNLGSLAMDRWPFGGKTSCPTAR